MWLINAVKSGKLEDVELALDQGEDVNEMDDDGCCALFYATMNGFKEITIRLLNVPGIKVDQQDTYMKQTPLMIAINDGKLEVVPTLLYAKADPDIGDKNGFTSMHYAAMRNDVSLIELLEKNGGNIHAQSLKHSTLLHSAAIGVTQYIPKWDLVKWLLDHKLDPNAVNDDNVSVSDTFAQKDHGFARVYENIINDSTLLGLHGGE